MLTQNSCHTSGMQLARVCVGFADVFVTIFTVWCHAPPSTFVFRKISSGMQQGVGL